MCIGKKYNFIALAGGFGSLSFGYVVQNCSFHVYLFNISTVVLGFPVTYVFNYPVHIFIFGCIEVPDAFIFSLDDPISGLFMLLNLKVLINNLRNFNLE